MLSYPPAFQEAWNVIWKFHSVGTRVLGRLEEPKWLSLLTTIGTDDSKGRIQLHGGRCSIPSFLCTTASKPCLEETFIFHTRTGDPFVTKLGSCCHGNAGFHTPAFHNVDFSESGYWRRVCLLETCGYWHQETTAARERLQRLWISTHLSRAEGVG